MLLRDLKAQVDTYPEQRLEEKLQELLKCTAENDTARNTWRIVASKGTLDMASPPLIWLAPPPPHITLFI